MILSLPDDLSNAELEEVESAFLAFEKAERPSLLKRRLRAHHSIRRELRPGFYRGSSRWLREIRAEVSPQLEGVRSEDDVARAIDWTAVEEMGRRILGPLYFNAMITSGVRIFKQRLDPIGAAAVEAAQKKSNELVTLITRQTKKALRLATGEVIDLGLPIDKLARMIRPLVGLNAPQSAALGRSAAEWIHQGLSTDEVSRRMGRLADKMLRYRADMIAATETARSTSEGVLTVYDQNKFGKVDLITDANACEVCLSAAAFNPYTTAEASGLLPFHPWCECVWVLAA